MLNHDQVEQALIADGWIYASHSTLTKPIFQKRIANYAPAGMLSNGARVITLELYGNSIYRVDGWGIVERALFIADFSDPIELIEKVLK